MWKCRASSRSTSSSQPREESNPSRNGARTSMPNPPSSPQPNGLLRPARRRARRPRRATRPRRGPPESSGSNQTSVTDQALELASCSMHTTWPLWITALGFPLGLPLTVTRGLVSGSDRTVPIDGVKRRKLVQTEAAVNPGKSDGPLIASDTCEGVGLVDLGIDRANGLAFAVSGQVAAPLLQAWRVAPQPITSTGCPSPPPPAFPAQAMYGQS
jgi:hypothetical protein